VTNESDNTAQPDGNIPSDDMSGYLQVFLDETDEELDALVEALLRLESAPTDDTVALNEAFRLLHSLKGSSGMMGYEGISELAHQLENRFEQFRSGEAQLDRDTMSVLLDSVDFLRRFSTALRGGEQLEQDGSRFVQRLEELEASPDRGAEIAGPQEDGYRVRVTFEKGLQLADLKARLIVARLSNIGEIVGSEPPVDDIQSFEDLDQFVVIVMTDRPPDEVREISNVDGVVAVELEGGSGNGARSESRELESAVAQAQTSTVTSVIEPLQPADTPLPMLEESRLAADASHKAVAETVRVDIDRLDRLMNLTGELVVTKARFTEITSRMSPAFRSASVSNRAKDINERMRSGLRRIREIAKRQSGNSNGWQAVLRELEEELDGLEEQSALWEEGRRQFVSVAEAVDQLSRVSDNLQQGVLDTRMVAAAPLFNRFRRVIRDLSIERNKRVQLVIQGENTELDKRMIDELGDPLLHLVRNSLDHGLEPETERRRLGKPEVGTVALKASHSGNNVLIEVGDDGSGINVDRVRSRILERSLTDQVSLDNLTDQEVIDHIWYPGFSTAEQITDISGRGVGMDIVKNRILGLNGAIDVDSQPGQGTCFTIRLPLTLAIIRSLLIRFGDGLFSIPIDDVREIVSVSTTQIFEVHRHQTIDVRGEFIPLTAMSNVFRWHGIDYGRRRVDAQLSIDAAPDVVNVVILQSSGKTLGLCVDELLGGADIVIKSLSDNFTSIQGLSGASVTGDGSVCLMLDTSAVIEMADGNLPRDSPR